MRKKRKKRSPILNELSSSFQMPVKVIYLGLSLVVCLTAIGLTAASLHQPQDPITQAVKIDDGLIGCNQPCTHNHQCQPNHFCFHGHCRLASNPLSLDCDPDQIVPSPTVEPVIIEVTATPVPHWDKGEEIPPIVEEIDEVTDIPDEIIDEEFPDYEDPEETYMPIPITEEAPTPLPSPTTAPDITDLDETPTGIGIIDQFLQSYDLSLPLVLGIGLAVLVVIVVLAAVLDNRGNSDFQPKDFAELDEKKLKAKPADAKLQPPVQNQTPLPEAAASKNAAESNSSSSSSTMVERVKKKGVEKPK